MRLKQHHLYGAAVAYAVVAGFLIQLLSRVLPAFGWSRVFPATIIILAAGFPVTVVLAWMLIKPKDPAKYSAWQKIHWKLGATLSVAVVIAAVVSSMFAWHLGRRHEARLASVQTAERGIAKPAAPVFNPPADTLVVLPFQNLSGDPKQQYFSDGITEELTGALGQNPDLRVIAWDTASTLRRTHQTAMEIGKQLNVADLLHGSLLREDDEVRITAELVNTVTGYELWSAHYDGSFKDIFKVQDEVSAAIANALKLKFAEADLSAGGTANPEAHELVLKGRALMESQDSASLAAARQDFEQATALDPNYADAHALLSRVLFTLTELSDLPLKTTLPAIRTEAKQALKFDPHNASAWVALGNAENSGDPPDIAKARADYEKALQLDPSNVSAHLDYGNTLPLKQALAEEQEATRIDPANETAWNNVAVYALDLGGWAQEIEATEALLKLDPKVVDSAFYLAFAYQQVKQYDKMVAAFDLVKPASPMDQEQVNTGRLAYQALGDPTLRPQALTALKALARHQSNQDVRGNLIQLYLALGDNGPALNLLESYCPADPVGCNDLAVNPMYKPLHGDSRFETLSKKYTTATLD